MAMFPTNLPGVVLHNVGQTAGQLGPQEHRMKEASGFANSEHYAEPGSFTDKLQHLRLLSGGLSFLIRESKH